MIVNRVSAYVLAYSALLQVGFAGACLTQVAALAATPATNEAPQSTGTLVPLVANPPSAASSERFYPAAISRLIEDGRNAMTILGIAAGGIWAYFNFFRGRTYRPRLEPRVSGTLLSAEDIVMLVASYDVKNVGLSKVDIQQAGSALSVLVPEMPASISFVREIKWKRAAVFDIFKVHQWIEPGELVQEQRLILLPYRQYPAVRLEVRLVSPAKTEWTAMTVVSPAQAEEPPPKDGLTEERTP